MGSDQGPDIPCVVKVDVNDHFYIMESSMHGAGGVYGISPHLADVQGTPVPQQAHDTAHRHHREYNDRHQTQNHKRVIWFRIIIGRRRCHHDGGGQPAAHHVQARLLQPRPTDPLTKVAQKL